MNDFFRRLPLMAKLFMIAVVPLLFISYLTIELYKEKSGNVSLAKSYLSKIDQSTNLSRLASALQKERRHSFVYALNKNNQNEMIAQRPATDSLLNQLRNATDENLKDFASYTNLEQLDSIRKRIDRGTYSKDQVMHFYSGAIFRLNTLNKTTPLIDKSLAQANDDLTTQRLLAQLITYQSIVDANVFNVLYTKQYMVETLLGTYPTWDVYKSYQKEFKVKAGPDALKKYEDFETKGALRIVDAYLDRLFSTFKFDSTHNYQTWAVAADNSIGELRAYQEQLITRIQERVDDYYRTESRARQKTIFYLVAIIMLIIVLLAYILYIINGTLVELKKAALKLSRGETDIRIKPQSKDAIGSLATSICMIDEKNKELSIAAQEIGNGNFDTAVMPRSGKDILGNAVVKMKEKLLHYTSDLKNAKNEFEKLAEFMPQIVWTADGDGRINYYNQKWYQITGTRDGFGDQLWIQVIHPDDVGHTLSAWYKAVETGHSFQMEYRIRDIRSNEYRWFLGRAVPVVNADNEIVKWFGTATDIQHQKLVEAKLEELVKLRTIELKRSNEDLQQFAHVASHDLKEPLRKISTFSERLNLEFGESIPEKGRTYLQKVLQSSKRMTDMITSILRYSVVNSTEQTEEQVNLNVLVDGIINDLELVIIQKEARVSYGNLPTITGGSTLIYQLFYNLVNNALKFSKPNVAPVIAISARKIPASELSNTLEIRPCASYHHITVQDNGIGFNQEYADRMFNIFTRLNGYDKYEGTGLGLALCRKIAQRHQGAIYATGSEDTGACFHLILPISE